MSLSDLASIGSLVSGIAVLISLVYLSVQVKQAERNQQASIRAVRATRTVDLFMGCTDANVADAVAKGMRGSEDITDTQIVQFTNYGNARFFNAEDAFYQYGEGLLNEFTLEGMTNGLKSSFSLPGMRVVYKRQRATLGREFVEFADKLLAATSVAPSVDAFGRFRADIAAERATAAS